jgi:hypothetical protein
MEQWDAELRTIHPRDVTDIASKAASENPNKRLIVHYMQPHAPYIGEFGRVLHSRSEFGHMNPDTASDSVISLAGAARRGEFTDSELRRAYRENLEVVSSHVRNLLKDLGGKTVITADHGEMLGEKCILFKQYGHPRSINNEILREVPWHTIHSSDRRSIEEDNPESFERLDETTVNKRLAALGYK